MKKLKQSSALLLIVSFLLSMFSFSAFAVNKITVKIVPKLLSKQEQEAVKGSLKDPGGQTIKNATFSLYKLGDVKMAAPNKSYVCEGDSNGKNLFPFTKTKDKQEVEISGTKYTFYAEKDPVKTASTGNDGTATVVFDEHESGWYLAIMTDAGEKTCVPTFIYVDTESSQQVQTVYPKALDMADDRDLPDIRKYILGANETRYVSKPGKKFVNGDGDDDRTIDYQIDVGIPKIRGAYRGGDAKQYGKEVDQKYSVFSVVDDGVENNQLVERIVSNYGKSKSQVEVMPISGDDTVCGVFAPGEDYTLKVVKKTVTVDFKRGGKGFSDKVKDILWKCRSDKNARFRIRFSVKINDLVKYFFDQKSKLGKDSKALLFLNSLDKTEKESTDQLEIDKDVVDEFKKMLRVENTARLSFKKDQTDKTIISNKVICQFGILCLRKIDKYGNKLSGAEFDLLNGIPSSLQTNNSDYKAKLLGNGTLGKNDRNDRYFAFLAGEPTVINKTSDKSKLSIEELNNIAEKSSNSPETFYLYETRPPKGYEKLTTTISVSLNGGFNYHKVVNIPTVNMPFAGGIGTILFTVVGILLTGSGAFLYMNSRRKKSTE